MCFNIKKKMFNILYFVLNTLKINFKYIYHRLGYNKLDILKHKRTYAYSKTY